MISQVHCSMCTSISTSSCHTCSCSMIVSLIRNSGSMNDSNAQLRDRVATLCAWSDLVFKRLTSRPNSRLEYGRWLKLVAEYYLDILNGDGSDQVHLAAT